MRTRPSAAADETLRNLTALLEFHASVQDAAYVDRVARLANEEARVVLEDMADRAQSDRQELAAILRTWRRLSPPRAGDAPTAEPLTLRELVEGWVEVKRTAADLYRRAANVAPGPGIADRLRALAMREDEDCDRLEALL